MGYNAHNLEINNNTCNSSERALKYKCWTIFSVIDNLKLLTLLGAEEISKK